MLELNRFKTNSRNETIIWIGQLFRKTRFAERTQVREFTFDDLTGTCGGYIGMFLGYALIQLPQFLQFLVDNIQKEILFRKAQKSTRNKINDDVIQIAQL